MAAQELRWLTFLLADLGERPSSAPTLFTDNKASILLCREPRLESRVKHIHVRYFLLRELQKRGQARFEFVESEANTADIFTKALPPCDHQSLVLLSHLVAFVAELVSHGEARGQRFDQPSARESGSVRARDGGGAGRGRPRRSGVQAAHGAHEGGGEAHRVPARPGSTGP
ncbi:unnamed protein product [Closterium sp. NIES-54]